MKRHSNCFPQLFSCLFIVLATGFMLGCTPATAERVPEVESVLDLVGDSANGEQLFNASSHGEANLPSCALCHSLEEGKEQTGPSLHGVGTRAEMAVAEQTAEEYLYYSIVDPNQTIMGDYYGGVMSAQYVDTLTDQEIADLIAYLNTLK